MSMRKIAEFLKINSGLYGTQRDEDRCLRLPVEGQRNQYAMLKLEGEQVFRPTGYWTIGGELGAIFRDSTGRSLLD